MFIYNEHTEGNPPSSPFLTTVDIFTDCIPCLNSNPASEISNSAENPSCMPTEKYPSPQLGLDQSSSRSTNTVIFDISDISWFNLGPEFGEIQMETPNSLQNRSTGSSDKTVYVDVLEQSPSEVCSRNQQVPSTSANSFNCSQLTGEMEAHEETSEEHHSQVADSTESSIMEPQTGQLPSEQTSAIPSQEPGIQLEPNVFVPMTIHHTQIFPHASEDSQPDTSFRPNPNDSRSTVNNTSKQPQNLEISPQPAVNCQSQNLADDRSDITVSNETQHSVHPRNEYHTNNEYPSHQASQYQNLEIQHPTYQEPQHYVRSQNETVTYGPEVSSHYYNPQSSTNPHVLGPRFPSQMPLSPGYVGPQHGSYYQNRDHVFHQLPHNSAYNQPSYSNNVRPPYLVHEASVSSQTQNSSIHLPPNPMYSQYLRPQEAEHFPTQNLAFNQPPNPMHSQHAGPQELLFAQAQQAAHNPPPNLGYPTNFGPQNSGIRQSQQCVNNQTPNRIFPWGLVPQNTAYFQDSPHLPHPRQSQNWPYPQHYQNLPYPQNPHINRSAINRHQNPFCPSYPAFQRPPLHQPRPELSNILQIRPDHPQYVYQYPTYQEERELPVHPNQRRSVHPSRARYFVHTELLKHYITEI